MENSKAKRILTLLSQAGKLVTEAQDQADGMPEARKLKDIDQAIAKLEHEIASAYGLEVV